MSTEYEDESNVDVQDGDVEPDVEQEQDADEAPDAQVEPDVVVKANRKPKAKTKPVKSNNKHVEEENPDNEDEAFIEQAVAKKRKATKKKPTAPVASPQPAAPTVEPDEEVIELVTKLHDIVPNLKKQRDEEKAYKKRLYDAMQESGFQSIPTASAGEVVMHKGERAPLNEKVIRDACKVHFIDFDDSQIDEFLSTVAEVRKQSATETFSVKYIPPGSKKRDAPKGKSKRRQS